MLEHDIAVGDGFAFLIFDQARQQALVQIGFVHLQQRRKDVGDGGLPVADKDGVGADGFHEQAGGEQVAAGVENVAAAGRPARIRAGY